MMNWSPTQLHNPPLQQHQTLTMRQQQQLSHNLGQSQTNHATMSQQSTMQAENMGQGLMGTNGMDPNTISVLAGL